MHVGYCKQVKLETDLLIMLILNLDCYFSGGLQNYKSCLAWVGSEEWHVFSNTCGAKANVQHLSAFGLLHTFVWNILFAGLRNSSN
jgi:hypothetical protein